MTAQEVLEKLSDEDIIKFMVHLGVEFYQERDTHIIFPTICHNEFQDEASMKLYYYKDKKFFKCYTECDNIGNIFDLVKLKLDVEFKEAFNYVCSFFNIDRSSSAIVGFGLKTRLQQEQEIFNKYNREFIREEVNLPIIKNQRLLHTFLDFYHSDWISDGICEEAMKLFNIKLDLEGERIVIPHHNEFGFVVGIRVRNFDKYELSMGRKYMPLILDKQMYTHSLKHNLYGLHKTKGAIAKYKKVILLESEKGVLQMQTFFGDENIGVAVCGSNVSKHQRDMLLSLGVDEVILAFDKQYQEYGDSEFLAWEKKIQKIANLFMPFTTFSVIRDKNGLLDYKDSPTDKGKEVFHELLNNRDTLGIDYYIDIDKLKKLEVKIC